VSSANLIRAQSATTDSAGRFCILNLPPGKYTVEVEAAAGFARFVRANVEVNLSKTSFVAIQVEPAGTTGEVMVSATSGSAIDTNSNTSGTNVSTEQFSNFTTQRTVQSIYTIAPSVTRSGLREPSGRDRDPSVAGSSGLENGYILDGINTTDPVFGGAGANLPFEFIQEVEIKTGAFGAEYGLATGGIFNVLTKSGGNSYVYSSLTGNYEGFYRNDTGLALPNLTSAFDLQSLLANNYGRLPNDRPHQLKFDGSYRTPWKLLVSGSFRAQSGIPFNALIPHPINGDNEGFDVPRGTAINPLTGRDRTPTTYNLDLGAYYPIKFGESRQLRIQVDWFNVTNTQRAIRQDETLRINSGIPGANAIQFPNPFYGQGTIFQYPSSLRLGIKFQF